MHTTQPQIEIVCETYNNYTHAGLPAQRKPRCPKGSNLSDVVYMLVYKREDHIKCTDNSYL